MPVWFEVEQVNFLLPNSNRMKVIKYACIQVLDKKIHLFSSVP